MKTEFSRVRIKNHFDTIAKYRPKWDDDLSQVSHLYDIRLTRTYEFLGAIDGLRFLDVGCGTGLAAGHIVKNGGQYFGIDLSRKMLKEFRGTTGQDGSIQLTTGILEDLPFSNASFDGVLCLGVLEYVEDLELAVSELSRVLRDNAIVIVSMQNPLSLYRLWDRYIYSGFLLNTLRKLWRRPNERKPLERITTFKDLKDVLSHHHLIAKNVVYYNFSLIVKPLDRLFPSISVLTSKTLEFLCHGIFGLLLGSDFLINAQEILSEIETISNKIL